MSIYGIDTAEREGSEIGRQQELAIHVPARCDIGDAASRGTGTG